MNEFKLKTREWEDLLSYSQKKKYANAIRNGYFSTYHGIGWRHDTFYGAYIWKHPGRVKVVKRFENLIGHRPGWEDITDDNLQDFYAELRDNYAPNSVRTICAEIAAVIRENNPTKSIPSAQFGKLMKSKKVPVRNVFLSMNEIRTLRSYVPKLHTDRYVLRMFLIECLTGARKSDSEKLSPQNINADNKTLTYVSKKSHIEVTVPIHKWLRPLLVKGDPLEPDSVPTATYNRCIQRICKKCGINNRVKVFNGGQEETGQKWKFVTSHTGRRSFATNLALKGVSIEQISLMMGHMSGNVPNISMTQGYIVGKMKLDSKVFDVFGTTTDY